MKSVAAAVPLVLVPTLGLAQGGYQPDTWVWAGALAAWACTVALVVSDVPGALRRTWPWAAAAGALLAWTLASALWSVHASQSVLEARRTLVYAAVVLALLLLARRGSSQTTALATHAAVSALIVYALLRYLLGARRTIEFEGRLLSDPLGYANAVGILATLGIVLAVGIAAERGSRLRRGAAAATVPPLALALQLSGSTASLLALAAGLLALTATGRALWVVATSAALAPAAAVLAGLGMYSGISTGAATRLSGPALAGIAAACAAAAAASVLAAPRPHGRVPRRLLVAALAVVAAGAVAAIVASGATEPRASYYRVAWSDEYLAHPVLGSGSATFGRYWVRFGKPLEFGGALDAHSLYLETLAELGPVGLALLAAMLLAPLRGVRRRMDEPLVPAALGAYAAFVVHAGLDWDWEIPAVVVAALCCAAAVATAGLHVERPLGRRARGAVLGAALVLGGLSIAGARSSTVPAASPETTRAPRRGALGRSHS